MPLRAALLALSVVVVWGVNFVVIDEGLHGVPPLLFAAVRFVLVAFPAVLLVRRPPVPWPQIALVGLTMSAGQFAFLYLALKSGMPPGLASLVLQSQVVVTVVLAAVFLHERVRLRQVVGLALGVVGLVVVGLGRSAVTPVIGVVLTVLAASAWALGNIAARRLRIQAGLPLVVWSALVVPVPLLLLSLLVEGPGSWARRPGHGAGARPRRRRTPSSSPRSTGTPSGTACSRGTAQPTSYRSRCWSRCSGSRQPGRSRGCFRVPSSGSVAQCCWAAPRLPCGPRPLHGGLLPREPAAQMTWKFVALGIRPTAVRRPCRRSRTLPSAIWRVQVGTGRARADLRPLRARAGRDTVAV